MPLTRVFDQAVAHTRTRPRLFHHLGALGLVGLAFAARDTLDPLWGTSYPLVFHGMAVLLSAALFSGPAGVLATAVSGTGAAWLYMVPQGSFWVSRLDQLVGLLVFCTNGVLTSLVLETLHRHAAQLRAAEHHRALLLAEFRHRARNDLQSLVGLLLLRARGAGPEAKEALREAAAHAHALASVHRRLEAAEADDEHGAYVDSGDFVRGLAKDLDRSGVDGLRPVALVVEAESHDIDTERAVSLGLVLNETLTNALKYGFPDERHGTVTITFRREGECFELVVEDDGVGLPDSGVVQPGTTPCHRTLGTRLLRGLAAQLRGSFRRCRRSAGGTRCLLSFPVDARS
jgi:two-component sensor histidine kinase